MSEAWIGILIGAAVVAGFGFVIFQKIKRRNSQWSGVVIDKDIVQTVHRNDQRPTSGVTFSNTGSAVTNSHFLKVRTDAGQELKWPVSDGLYVAINIGDRLTKPAGTEIPQVTQKAQAPQPQTAQPSVDATADPTQTPPQIPPFAGQ